MGLVGMSSKWMRFMDFLLRLLCRQTDGKLVNRPETHSCQQNLKHTLVNRTWNTLLSTDLKHTLVNRMETHSFQKNWNTTSKRNTTGRQAIPTQIARTAIHFLLFWGQSSCDARSRRPVLPRRKREPAWREQKKKHPRTYSDSYGSGGGLGQSEDLLQDLLW